MRTRVATSVIGVSLLGMSLIAGPAMAQQHPWVPSCVYEGGCWSVFSPPQAHARASHPVRSADRPRAGNTAAAGSAK